MGKLLFIAILALSCSSYAWVEKAPIQKEYTFKYQLKGQSLEIKRTGNSYDEAFEGAAQKCFDFFKGPGRVSENRGLDIIDVCANPRS